MPWLQPFQIAALCSTAILACLFFLLNLEHRRTYLALWGVSLGLYSLNVALQAFPPFPDLAPWGLLLQYLLPLGSTWLTLRGVFLFLDRTAPPWLDWFLALAAAGSTLGHLLGGDRLGLWAFGVFLAIGGCQAGAGVILLRRVDLPGPGRHLAGWGLLAWGLHRADYPLLREVAWFAPFGFLLSSLLALVVAMGALLLLFERLRKEQAETSRTLGTILDLAPVGIALLRRGRLAWANDYLHTLLASSPQSLLHQPLAALLSLQGQDEAAADASQPWEVEIKRPDGEPLFLRLLFRPLETTRPGGDRLLVLVDISEPKRAKLALQSLAAGVAHSFNNLLMAIIANARAAQSLLASAPGGGAEEARRHLDIAVNAALAGRDVTRRLASTAASRPRNPANLEAVDLGRLTRDAVRLALTGTPHGQGLGLRNEVPSGLFVRGIPGELLEVFLNLVRNAMEAMPRGGDLELTGRIEGDEVLVEVADRGVGLEQSLLPRIFEPFFTTKGTAGRGLGLATSQGILRAHGGALTAAPRPGGGSVFTVRLPRLPPPPPEGAPAAPRPGLAGRKVLLVEDEGLVALGLEASLGAEGMLVRTAGSVAEAIRDLATAWPDLILCDFGLPDGTAWRVAQEAARRAKEHPRGPSLVILTGRDPDDLASQRPPDLPLPLRLLQKPVDHPALLRVLEEALAAPA